MTKTQGMNQSAGIKVTLNKSLAGQLRSIIASVRGLGLRRIRHSVMVKDTPENRGLIKAAGHLLTVESGQSRTGK